MLANDVMKHACERTQGDERMRSLGGTFAVFIRCVFLAGNPLNFNKTMAHVFNFSGLSATPDSVVKVWEQKAAVLDNIQESYAAADHHSTDGRTLRNMLLMAASTPASKKVYIFFVCCICVFVFNFFLGVFYQGPSVAAVGNAMQSTHEASRKGHGLKSTVVDAGGELVRSQHFAHAGLLILCVCVCARLSIPWPKPVSEQAARIASVSPTMVFCYVCRESNMYFV